MVTDDDRAFAREFAVRLRKYHIDRGHQDKQISTVDDGAESHRIGALGECAYTHEFGGAMDLTFRPHGDDRDFHLHLMTEDGPRRFDVDVKTFSYQGPGFSLLVPVRDIKDFTIYIVGSYRKSDDDVNLVAWEWGRQLIKEGNRRILNSRGVENYAKLVAQCRRLSELKERMIDVKAAISTV